MTDILLPSMGEGVERGTVISILVQVGDQVEVDQPLLEVETDKVTAEVPCETPGKVVEILVSIGDEIPEGTPIIRLEASDTQPPPKEAERVYSVEKSLGDESASTHQDPQLDISEEASPQPVQAPTDVEIISQPVPANATDRGGYRSSPLARKMAREIGVNIALVTPSNGAPRVSVKDVKIFAKEQLQNRKTSVNILAAPSLPNFAKYGSIRRESLNAITKATAQNMAQAWTHVPHAWLEEKIDITDLETSRQRHKGKIKEQGGSLTITAILVKSIAQVLKEFPRFGASIDTVANEIIYKDYVHIGVAVDTDRGLVVPVIRDADQLSLTEISVALSQISKKARDKKLKAEDLEGATFTISNLGGIGTTSIFPIVNHPQAAIMGVASSTMTPTWINEEFLPRLIMPVTIGFDHRLINGADAARFLRRLKSILEDWFTISM